jgi:hypothetical protein
MILFWLPLVATSPALDMAWANFAPPCATR